ncbi:tetratricopeptide repeat protein [Mesorhizobium sp. L-8-3]|uniref:tetratricopeptide repeat protein n=1 Tax=Mesorhizobium sp. L-8-3 TaxID=2744522 RepID=UPI0019256E77|nr:tetratricopeptide repeat protein [Mesorhizobium sp. L-8-3]BCH27253.1 hypothetical protein MesoLjLb_70380 [Mesorhizobium sp. L-8-3]
MIQAVVSGQSGGYAIASGDALVVSYFDPERSHTVRFGAPLFSGVLDAEWIQLESESDVRKEALLRYNVYLGWRLTLLLFDEDEDEDDRISIAQDLDKIISSEDVRALVEARLFSKPLPQGVDWPNFEHLNCEFVRSLLAEWRSLQDAIRIVRDAFDSVDQGHFSPDAPYDEFESIAVRRGCFSTLVRAITSEEKRNIAILSLFTTLADVPGSRKVVTAWTKDFKQKANGRTLEPEREDADLDGYQGLDGWASHQAFQNVRRQQKAIVERLQEGNIEGAKRFTSELVQSQLGNSQDTEFVAKSLCKLSQEAKALELWDVQLEWANWAAQLRPSDPWTHGQEADALINVGRLLEAQAALDRAAAAGDRLYAATGRARILRETGQLKESRAAYLRAFEEHSSEPDAVHALVGAAAVAREMGDLQVSLREFNTTLNKYPGESFVLVSKAATLIELGEWREAIKALDAAREISPGDVAISLQRASVYKLGGQLDYAIREYSRMVTRHPYYPQAHYGLIDTYRTMERFVDASTALKAALDRFPKNGMLIALGADIQRESGRPQDALRSLEALIARGSSYHDSRIVGALGRLYRAASRNADALALVDRAVAENPKNMWLKLDRADLLMRLGSVAEALKAFDELLLDQPKSVRALNAKASLLGAVGRLSHALEVLPNAKQPQTQDEWRSFILKGILLTRQGKGKDALIHLNIQPGSIPFAKERRLFSNAVALAELSVGRTDAAAAISQDKQGELANVIYFHTLAATRSPKAQRAYREMSGLTESLVVLKDEIARQYRVIDGGPQYSKQWLFEMEQNALMLEAA